MYKTKHHASNQYITELYSETGIETLMKGTAILHKALSKLRISFYLSLSHLPPRARGVGTQHDRLLFRISTTVQKRTFFAR